MIDLSRAEGIGDKKYRDKETTPTFDVDVRASISIEVLFDKDVIFSSMNVGKRIKGEWKWACGYCKEYTLQPVIEYRCIRCQSKVIKVGETKHPRYEYYITNERGRSWKQNIG
jgi:hypothetical protein